MSYLVLVRHGESQWNALGKWTGWTDIPLSENGHEEARKAGSLLRDIHFDAAYTSLLTRAQETLDDIKNELGIPILPTHQNGALNERNYGVYTGKNKWEVKSQMGEEEFMKLRRSWDYPIEQGESLKQVYERVLPYYESEILPELKQGKNVLIAAHGNSLRALMKHLDNIPDDEISKVEIATGEALVYQIDANGNVLSKEARGENHNKGKQ